MGMIKIVMINNDKKIEGTMMMMSMIVMKMLIVARMMMMMMMQLPICKTDKWEKHNPSGSPPVAKWPQVQVPSYQTFPNCSQIAKSCSE